MYFHIKNDVKCKHFLGATRFSEARFSEPLFPEHSPLSFSRELKRFGSAKSIARFSEVGDDAMNVVNCIYSTDPGTLTPQLFSSGPSGRVAHATTPCAHLSVGCFPYNQRV